MELYVAILTGCAVLAVLVLLALAFRVWLTCRQAEMFFTVLSRQLPPTLEELRGAAKNINETTHIIQNRVAETDRQVSSVTGKFFAMSKDLLNKCNELQEYLSPAKLKTALIIPAAYKVYKQFFSSKNPLEEGSNNE